MRKNEKVRDEFVPGWRYRGRGSYVPCKFLPTPFVSTTVTMGENLKTYLIGTISFFWYMPRTETGNPEQKLYLEIHTKTHA